ncbi:hypothetical protein PIB30_017946 [Stylosanthes scabra]|uniref:Uncharacterized protein n=1 Tax=Stylosanthes scabra TaxID=79078 RepID=A0ABU6S8F7_9FABA|nr:hypothetical protein [Stylosanthes scabra]
MSLGTVMGSSRRTATDACISLSTKVGVRLLVYSLPQHPTKWDLNWLLPKEVIQPLPKPLPESILEMPNKQDKEDKDEQEENEQSVDHLSPEDLLKGHIKRAKRVKAR